MNLHNQSRKEMLRRLSILDFMILDLGLYLNSRPNDTAALNIHAAVAEDAEKLRKAYEADHGPLTTRNASDCNKKWQWISDLWPRDAEFNFEIKEVAP